MKALSYLPIVTMKLFPIGRWFSAPIRVWPGQKSLVMASVLGTATMLCAQQSAPSLAPGAPWKLQNSTTRAGLRGIHAVGGGIAWASGTDGTVLRTEDGGYMWQSCAMPPGAEQLDFRSVWAWDANTAVVMSSGPGVLSRLYKTTDGCSSWKLLYTNPDKDGFWDAMQCPDKNSAFILGDPVNGKLTLFSTSLQNGQRDAGSLDVEGFDAKNVAAFAASNSSLVLVENVAPMGSLSLQDHVGKRVGLGGKAGSRVLIQEPNAKTHSGAVRWTSVPVPLASGNESSGVFSLAFRDQNHGIAAGGDYKKPNESRGTSAYTSNGGKTWTSATKPPYGYRSAVAWDAADKAWITAGTNGSDISYDDGRTWEPLDSGKWNALSLPWVVGPEGRIAKLVSLKH